MCGSTRTECFAPSCITTMTRGASFDATSNSYKARRPVCLLNHNNTFRKGEFIVKQKILVIGLIAILAGLQLTVAASNRDGKAVTFHVRIENISTKDGFTASNGTKFSVALSPGLWVVHELEVRLYKEGVVAGTA